MRPKQLFSALSLLSLCSLGALATGGCADNRTTLFIAGVRYFEPGGDCEADESLGGNQLLSGSYDPLSGFPYYAWVIVANGLQPLGDNDTLRPETSRIQLQGAEISVRTVTGAAAAPAFTINFSATISPDDSEDPGVAVLPIPILQPSLSLNPGDYQVGITVFGETLGGTDVESGEFDFPVTVLPAGSLYSCQATSESESVHPCGPLAQDGYTYPCGGSSSEACLNLCGP